MAKIIIPPYFESVVNDGEKRLLNFLEVHLPDTYTLIPNVEIASTDPRNGHTRYWEYDLIVVAPHAVFNIENKDWKGRIEGDDTYWYHNDRQKPSPLRIGRQKTAILASKLKEEMHEWGRAWVQNLVTLSFHNSTAPTFWQEAGKLTFELKPNLITFLTDHTKVGKSADAIADIQVGIVEFLTGAQYKRKPEDKREVEGYEIIEVLQQEPNFVEYLGKPKGVASSLQKRIKEYSMQVSGFTKEQLLQREEQVMNQYKALHKIKGHPFILNVEFKIDNENHLFYEIADYLDDNSLRAEARHKTFTFSEKINIIRNLIDALKVAHAENVFHRDINPDNIFISSGYARLGNFGKSYFADHHAQGYTVMPTIKESNATAYHPLELTVGDASRRSDIYSLAVLIYWLFTGKEPIENPFELNRLGGRLPADRLPAAVNKALPKWLDSLCEHCILTEEAARWDTLEDLSEFIEGNLKENPTRAEEAAPKQRAPQKDLSELKEGDRIDNNLIIHEILGKGGYSLVFKVKHDIQEEYYACKLFHESVAIKSVQDEYSALVKLDHPNVVKFKWNGTSNAGQFFTIMEFLEGESLSNYCRTDARLPIYKVYQLANEMLSALIAMQERERPIFHRDIKPQNIIWDRESRFVLIDFNVASFAEDNKDFVGTNPYLAPDLIETGYKVAWNKSADVFALGVTLYELVCKQYPWTPGRMPLVGKAPANPKELEPSISEAFSDFLLKAIATNGTERFANAREMQGALHAIGEKNLLSAVRKPMVLVAADADAEQLDMVTYVNSLYSQSRHGNAGTRANFVASVYDRETYTPTKLDEKLIPAVLDGQFKLLIITGNAGDGKTAFIQRIEQASQATDLTRFEHKNGARFKINGVPFESNYDGSQDEQGKVNNEVLEAFFKPFEGLTNYRDAKEGRIIAINEGRLVEFLQTSGQHKGLAEIIANYFYEEGHSQLTEGLMVINLNLRSVVADDKGGASLFRKQVRALTKPELWKQCAGCDLANRCFIKYNVDSFNDTTGGESVISRMEWILRTASLKREIHITMRDLRSFIAFTLTRDQRCVDVETLFQKHDTYPERYWQYYYFNVTNALMRDGGQQDRLVQLLRETDVGQVAVPDQDRDLYFGKHREADFIPFNEREISLIDAFNNYKILVPAYEQAPEVLERIMEIQKVFVRHQYFEGKAKTIIIENNAQPGQSEMPFYLARLPYHSAFEFLEVLRETTLGAETKRSISRAISLNEGCDNEGIDKNYLVLASSESNDPIGKSFRLFPLDDFELFVNRTDHLVDYLEYEPDSLVFRHRSKKHIRITVSLDLYEMLYFIHRGFNPSLNDLRGKFIELLIFKNLLENLEYDKVLVTEDNRDYYQISRTPSNTLEITPFQLN